MSKRVSSTYSSTTYDTGKHVIKKEWDAVKAETVYRLYSKYETFTDGFVRPRSHLHYIAHGNIDWAKSTAEHYGIEIEAES